MIINVSNVVKRYSKKEVLDHINLNIEEGEIYGLLGPNGAGKTTLINCILGLLKYDLGEIKIFDKTMNENAYDIKRRIGYIPQNVSVFEELTVYENVDFFCSLYVSDKVERKSLVDRAISFVSLDDYKTYLPKKLSGGLVRRLNIACGIAHKPDFIILDEPTVAVDPQSRNSILEGIKKLNEEGATIIYTSHYMEEVELICSKIGVMDLGKIIIEGTKEELKKSISTDEIINIEVMDLEDEILNTIKSINNVSNIQYKDNVLKVSISESKPKVLIDILNILTKNKYNIDSINTEEITLNNVFLELTGKKLRD